MRMRVGRVAQPLRGQADHFVGDVHPVDLAEVAAQGPHQASRAAADFERRIPAAHPFQVQFQALHNFAGRGEKLFVVLLAPAEGNIVVGVFAGALVPIGAHALQYFGIFHRGSCYSNVYVSCISQRHQCAAGEPGRGRAGWNRGRHHRRERFRQEPPVAARRGPGNSHFRHRQSLWRRPLAGAGRCPESRAGAGAAHRPHFRPPGPGCPRARRRRARPHTPRRGHHTAGVARRGTHPPSRRRSLVAPPGQTGRTRRSRRDAGGVSQARRRAKLRAWGESITPPLAPTVRRGDGRAEILRVETIGESGKPTMVWRCGERAVVRVAVRFREAVADPVVGIMIRTRIGLNVYGTNTELEEAEARSLQRRQYAGTGLRLLVRALPRGVHAHRGVARSRRRLARLAGGCRRVHRQRFALHRRRGESTRPGEPAGAELRLAQDRSLTSTVS